MIKVDKDLAKIPISLSVKDEDIDKVPAKTTHRKRMKVINDGSYPPSDHSCSYDKCYKADDIKNALNTLYHGKCAFCETRTEVMHVEHFRPKRGNPGYYWLAFSWDNLLLCCPACNRNKGNRFPLAEGGTRATFTNTAANIQNIHHLSSDYDLTERPLMVNPETVTEDELGTLTFTRDGNVMSDNHRMSETISICKLQRSPLCESRKVIWDDLVREIHIAAAQYGVGTKGFVDALRVSVLAFRSKAHSVNSDFLAFRNFILSSKWIEDEIRLLLDSWIL